MITHSFWYLIRVLPNYRPPNDANSDKPCFFPYKMILILVLSTSTRCDQKLINKIMYAILM